MELPYRLHLGDCLQVLKTFPDNSFDSVVTDPPYGLSFMGKRWDYDVPSVEIWAECLRVLKPGGHLLAFAGTRTQHRMAVRIEDAGFEIRDMIAWVYGSGFPKSMDVGKAIDKAAGAEREVIGPPTRHGGGSNSVYAQDEWTKANQASMGAKTAPATEAAAQWDGWGTALKPAPGADHCRSQAADWHRGGQCSGAWDRGTEHRRLSHSNRRGSACRVWRNSLPARRACTTHTVRRSQRRASLH